MAVSNTTTSPDPTVYQSWVSAQKQLDDDIKSPTNVSGDKLQQDASAAQATAEAASQYLGDTGHAEMSAAAGDLSSADAAVQSNPSQAALLNVGFYADQYEHAGTTPSSLPGTDPLATLPWQIEDDSQAFNPPPGAGALSEGEQTEGFNPADNKTP